MHETNKINFEYSGLTVAEHTNKALRKFFIDLQRKQPPNDLYKQLLLEMELPLLLVVLEYTRGNQTTAAEILGINRGTLRKKLKQHQIIHEQK